MSDAAVAAAARLRRTTLTTRAAILALVVAVLTVTLAIPVRAWFAQRADIARLQDDVAAARVRVADLQEQQRRWQDPAYIEAQARERLQYVMPGEIGYVVLGGDLETQAPAARVETLDDSAWYVRLWSAVRAADATPRPSGAPVVPAPAGGPAADAPIGPSPSTSPSPAAAPAGAARR